MTLVKRNFHKLEEARAYSEVILMLVILLFFGSPAGAQSSLSVSIQPPGLNGMLRYGHWAPLPVKIERKSKGAGSFSGTVQVRGAGGFDVSRSIQLSSDQAGRTVRLPVFCSSSFPVFTVRLFGREGGELAREQQRFRHVFSQDQVLIGLSERLSDAARRRIRSSWSHRTVVFQSAPREELISLASWPGLVDVMYLDRPSNKSSVERTQTLVHVYRPEKNVNTRVPLKVSIRPVDPRTYDLFERPNVSERRSSWFAGSVWIQLFVIAGLLFLGIWIRSSLIIWSLIAVVPVGLGSFLYIRAPKKPPFIRQIISMQIHDGPSGQSIVDQRVSLFPFGTGEEKKGNSSAETVRVTYPLNDVRRSIPLFFRESSIKKRFPKLQKQDKEWHFRWETFPAKGYFALQHFKKQMDRTNLLAVSSSTGEVKIENVSSRPIRKVLVFHEDQYYRVGPLPEGEETTVALEDRTAGTSSREQILDDLFGPETRRDRILRRAAGILLDRYASDEMYVMGVMERNTLQTVTDNRFEDQQFPTLLLQRIK